MARTDADLLAGGADDFGIFYERHVAALTAYVGRRAVRPDLTFDLVAETFARALEHRGRFDESRGPAVAWLIGIARNLMIDAARRGRVADHARARLGLGRIELDDEQLVRIEERSRVDLGAASLTSQDSAPLTGKVGGKPGAGPSGASKYVIELLPDLSAGQTGWCATLALAHSNGQPIAGGEGCGPAPPAAAPQIVGGALVATTSASGESVSYVVVDDRVASVRVDGGRLIIPRSSAAIPSGWKAAVWFTAGGAAPAMPVLLDKAGQVISTAPNERAGTRAAGTRKLATRAVDPARPPRRRCAIAVPSPAGLRAISERVVTATPAHAPDVNGRAFRTCASAVIYLGGRRFTAAVLVDARNPSRQAAPLPGQRPHPGATGVVEAGGRITARRAGPGWLVVRGINRAQRLRLLRALNTGR